MLITFVHDQWVQAVTGQGFLKGDGKVEEGISECMWQEEGCLWMIDRSYNADNSWLWYIIIAFQKIGLVLFREIVNVCRILQMLGCEF